MDILAEDGEEASEGGSVDRVTPATSVEGPDTGPSTARDEVTHSHPYTQCLSYFFIKDNNNNTCELHDR